MGDFAQRNTQVPPSERGVSLAQRRKAVGNAAPGVRVQSRRDKALSRGDKTPPQVRLVQEDPLAAKRLRGGGLFCNTSICFVTVVA